jgi:HK97 family phage prohead protease
MAYFITDQSEECPNWATVKDDGTVIPGGCHETKQEAIDHMVAASLAEDIPAGGDYEADAVARPRSVRALPGEVEINDFVEWDSSGGMARGRVEQIITRGEIDVPDSDFTIQGTEEDPAALIRIYRQSENEDGQMEWQATETLVGHRFSTLTPIEPLSRSLLGLITRQVNLDPPAYMRAAARRGLQFYEDGLGGDGLRDQTIAEARAMARGNVTADKWVRLRAWIARHLSDLRAPGADPDSDEYPTPGVVAHLLWGSGPSIRAAERALAYADGVVARLEEDNEGRARSHAVSAMEVRVNQTDYKIDETQDGMTFEGYAAIFDSSSHPLPGSMRSATFVERIQPGAFIRSLKARNDIKLLWSHDTAEVLGSTRAGTLKLIEDERGLKVQASLPNTTRGRDAAELIRRGDVDAMSFGFTVPKGGDDWSEDGSERTLREVALHEVSIVSFPAYQDTAGTASVRGLAKVAKRANVDVDGLADALLKLENGEQMTEEDTRLLTEVLDSIAPEKQANDDIPDETANGDKAMLELKKKKLALLMGI